MKNLITKHSWRSVMMALVVVITTHYALAQDFDYSWMRMITFDQEMVNTDMKVYNDSQGNTYTTFTFQWDIHLGRPPRKKKDPEPPLLSAGDALYGLYFDKRDAQGDISWAKVVQLGDANKADNLIAFFNRCADLAVSDTGDIYMTGTFDAQIDFGNNIGLTSKGRDDMFIAKFNSSGDAQWAIRAGGSGEEYAEADPGGTSIALDGSGNVYVSGILNAYPNGGGTFGDQALDLSKDGAQAVLAKLDSSGKVHWLKKAPAGTFSPNNDLALDDSGNIYLSGFASFSADWEGNKTTVNGLRDAVIFKLDNSGSHVWTKVWGYGNGAFDGKTMDAEGLINLSVSGDGKIAAMLTLHEGAEIGDKKITLDKKAVSKLAPAVVTLDQEGNVTNALTFEGDFLNVPSAGMTGDNGKIFFKLGGKGKIIDEKTKGGGYYSLNADGQLSLMFKSYIKDPG